MARARFLKSGKSNVDIDRDMLMNMIKDTKIPILTLDARWNTLFEKERKRPEIKKLVNTLNNLLKEQGGMVNKVKDLKKLKKKLMNNIVDNMESSGSVIDDRMRHRKQEANSKLIGDINSQLEYGEDRLMELPYEIMKVNKQLLIESMICCYERINADMRRSNEIEEWLKQIAIEIDSNTKEKEEIDKNINQIYSFMHDLVGGSVIEIFDSSFGKHD